MLTGCKISNMSGAAITVEGNGVNPPANLLPVDVLVDDLEIHNVGRMWDMDYKGVDLGFFPLTFGGYRTVIANKIKLSGVTLHDSGKHPDQAFAGCHSANPPRGLSRDHPVLCDPANLTGLSGDISIFTSQPKVCSKANLGTAGKDLTVTCTTTDSDEPLKTDDNTAAPLMRISATERDKSFSLPPLAGTWAVGQRITLAGRCKGSKVPPLVFRPRGSVTTVACSAADTCIFTPDCTEDYVVGFLAAGASSRLTDA
jgi:hypothetical protein